MEKKIPIHLQEIIFASSNSAVSKQISKLKKEKKIRKIAPRIYTSDFDDKPEAIIKRNLFFILGKLYPNSVLSHRSALEFRPTTSSQIFVTYKYTRKVKLPGIEIRFLEGSGPIEGDTQFSEDLYVSQQSRAFLENMQISRKIGANSKTLSRILIEEKLEKIIKIYGEEELNKIRDKARLIAGKLHMKDEFIKLNKIISALLSTHPSKILKSPLAAARAFGHPYDKARLELFEILFYELNKQDFIIRKEKNISTNAFKNFAFFESYFSNYIEGTEFHIDEAKQIIKSQLPLSARNEDSHDILGTYKIVSNLKEMSVIPDSVEDFIKILQYRHRVILNARKNSNPGLFKNKNNFAGKTAFVDKELVKGTISKSFDFYRVIKHPFAKAVYMMFIISEIHPFLDGNGRIARIMMNAELTSENQTKIIIPTVFREDYLLTLRRLTRNNDPKPYIRMLTKAQEFSHTVTGNNMDKMQNILDKSNAFTEPSEGKLNIMP
ncbi:MAG: Fic family protein [Bacteroidales bacterium]|nr:Fic family protein [Bacteroidales bacterium]